MTFAFASEVDGLRQHLDQAVAAFEDMTRAWQMRGADLSELREWLAQVKAERDDALAALARVRKAAGDYQPCVTPTRNAYYPGWLDAMAHISAALAGAAEPQEETPLCRCAHGAPWHAFGDCYVAGCSCPEYAVTNRAAGEQQ